VFLEGLSAIIFVRRLCGGFIRRLCGGLEVLAPIHKFI